MTNVRLSDEDQAFVEEEVRAGVYRDIDEAVHAGLRLLKSNEGKFAELRRLIQEGIDDFEAGRVIEFEDADSLTDYIVNGSKEKRNAAAQTEIDSARAPRPSRHL
jgi:antitoxin ParD1/3/4